MEKIYERFCKKYLKIFAIITVNTGIPVMRNVYVMQSEMAVVARLID